MPLAHRPLTHSAGADILLNVTPHALLLELSLNQLFGAVNTKVARQRVVMKSLQNLRLDALLGGNPNAVLVPEQTTVVCCPSYICPSRRTGRNLRDSVLNLRVYLLESLH